MISIKKIILISLLWILITCGILILLFNSKWGVNLIFTGMKHYIPGFTFDSISGDWRDIQIFHIVYQMPLGLIKIEELSLSINLKYILFKQIKLEYLILRNVSINIPKSISIGNVMQNHKENKISQIVLNWYSIIINNATLYNVYIMLHNTIFQIHKVDTGLVFQNNLLRILPTYIRGGFVSNRFLEDILLRKVNTISTNATLWIKDISNITCILKSIVRDELIKKLQYRYIPINFIVTQIQGKNLYIYKYNNNSVINYFTAQAHWNTETANIKLRIDLPHGSLRSTGNICFKQNYPVYIKTNYIRSVDINNNSNKLYQNFKNIEFIITGDLIEELLIRCNVLYFISTIHIILKIKLTHWGVPTNLSIVARKIPIIALRDSEEFILEKFNLYLTGNIYNYRIQIESELMHSKISKVYIFMNAQGNPDNCIISKLRIIILDGCCEITGKINWGEIISWSNVFIFKNIHIFQKYLKYPVQLSGHMMLQGRLYRDTWELTISKINLHGNIKNHNIICSGSMYIGPNGQWNIPIFLVNWNGFNILKIQGELQQDHIFYIDTTIKILDCAVLSSKFIGNLHGHCKLYGSMQSPNVSIKLNGNSLGWNDKNISIGHVLIDGNLYYDNSIKSDFFLKLKNIKYKDLLLYKLIVIGKGNLNKHDINFEIFSNKLSGVIKMIGRYNFKDQIWNGNISKTTMVTPMGTWQLMQDIVLIYHYISREVIVKSHYWNSNFCQIPVSGMIQNHILKNTNTIFKNTVDLDLIPIEMMTTQNVRIFFTDFSWNYGKKFPIGSISLLGTHFGIKYLDEDKIIPMIILKHVTIRVVMTQTSLFCSWIIDMNHNRNFGRFLVTDLYNNIPRIIGDINVQNFALEPVCKLLSKSKESVHGLLNINVNFQGHLYHPKIHGYIQLTHCNINKPNTIFFIKNSSLKIDFFGDFAVFYGKLETGYDGQLFLSGKITNFSSIHNLHAVLNIQGNQVNIRVSPKIQIKTSPKITCTMTTKKINIQGHLDIPWAYIKIQEFEKNIIEISSEEIILDKTCKSISNHSTNFMFFVFSNLTICFGDDVYFSGFGVHDVKLKGNLEIACNKKDLTVIGHINIYSGNLNTYGQNLIIQRGQLLFSGAINQAFLDIEAIRNSDFISSNINKSMISGVRITGMINKLKLEFFSNESSLSQRKAISYLLGRNNLIYTDLQDTNNIITSLLVGASMERYEKFINKIGKTLGVQNLTVNTQDFGTTSCIAFSGYITPGLQIKYGISMYDLLTTIRIRYCLYSQLYLEATSSGSVQAVDLLYQFNS